MASSASRPAGAGRGARRWAGAVGVWLVLVAGCAGPMRVVLRGPEAPPRLAFAPSPELQELVDPRPAAPGALAWLGGDVASSVQVGADRWIWIFGDTVLGTVAGDCPGGVVYCNRDVDDRPTHAMIANSVGVTTRDAAGALAPLATYWRTDGGVPAPIFAAEDPNEFLWPLALAAVDDVLLVAASRHTRAAGLESLGSVLVRVENPEAAPDRWRYRRFGLPHVRAETTDSEPLTWATALVADADFVYLFGRLGVGTEARTVVARFPAAGVGDPAWSPAPTYLTRVAPGHARGDDPPVWTTTFDARRLHVVEGLPGTSEAAFVFDETRWYTVRIAWLGHELELYTAADLTGPWHAAGVVYAIPPPEGCTGVIGDPAAACAGAPYFAYAAKPHAGLGPPGTYVVSYNINVLTTDLEDALRAVEHARAFYVPRLVIGMPMDRLQP